MNFLIEFCKIFVVFLSDVMIIMDEDDDKLMLLLLIFESEFLFVELIYVRGELIMEMKIDIVEKIGLCSEVMKMNDYEGVWGDNDDMVMKDSIGEGK